ncbi:Piwi domain-containing protein [Methylobacter sp. BBA5.1]|uniref:Piwi domain-containing protein n=1 Tax=Methylobacter sp. BBA5.1 TaxID=1495064 RepID=UPI0005641B71|nr:Piwi domain-containing protein [Methylobacter sp. BBA5.1]
MDNLALSALQLDSRLDHCMVYQYRIVYHKFDETEAGEKLARKAAYELWKVNNFGLLTNLGASSILSLKSLSQLSIDSPLLQASLKADGQLELDCGNEQHQEALQRLVNQDINKAAWNLKQASEGKLDCRKSPGGHAEIFEPSHSSRIKAHSTYLDAFCTVRLIPEVLSDGTVLIGLHLKHSLTAKADISLQWVIDHRPDWLISIEKVRHRYYEPGKAPLVAEFVKVDDSINGSSLLPHLGKSLVAYHQEKGLLSAGQLAEAATSSLIKVRYGQKEADHVASLVEPMFDFDTLSKIDSPFLNRLAKDLKWSLDDRIKTSAEMVKRLYLPGFNRKLVQVDYQNLSRKRFNHNLMLQFADGARSGHEQDVLKYKAFADMTRARVIPLVVGERNNTESNRQLLRNAYNALRQLTKAELPPFTSFPPSIGNADELDARLHKKCPDNAILLIGLTEKSDKAAIRDTAFNYGLVTQFMRLDHKPKVYDSFYFNNVAAGLFSKGGGQLCAVNDMPGETELFIGLDMGGVNVRAPGFAFLFLNSGAQLGWQLADKQQGEKMQDDALSNLLEKSLKTYLRSTDGLLPRRITLHRDGRFYESINVIEQFEQKHGVKLDVLEVLKSGAPVLYRRERSADGKKVFSNPGVGDAVFLSDREVILSTYSGEELGKSWGNKVSVRPLRLRKRYGETALSVLAHQVLVLSRIHGASLYRHPRLPVTTHHADRFATLRQDACIDALSKMDRLCPVYL